MMLLTDTPPTNEHAPAPAMLAPAKKADRLISLDALRGFDMLCIMGLVEVVRVCAKVWPTRWMQAVDVQLEHEDWQGFHFYDLIFPLFVFLVGVSLVLSLGKIIQTRGTGAAVWRIVSRSIVLFLLGILYNSGIGKTFADVRIMGVLQRIALSYLVAGLLFCFTGRKTMMAVAGAILVGYWVLLVFVPVPGGTSHSFAEGQNWPNWIDAKYLPLFKYNGDHDPEGLLSTFPAIVTCLLGVFAGMLLKASSVGPSMKVVWLLLGGGACLAGGYAWGLEFPIIKKLWTSSYVLVAGGYSAILLGLFYLVIDVWRLQRWTAPLLWVGMNAITLYLIHHLFGRPKVDKIPGRSTFELLAERCIGGEFSSRVLGAYGQLAVEVLALVFLLLLARFLYKKQIFLRV